MFDDEALQSLKMRVRENVRSKILKDAAKDGIKIEATEIEAATLKELRKMEMSVQAHVTGRVSRDDIDDVVQEIWILIIENQDKYNPERGPVWPWTKFHCKSAVSKYYRKKRPSEDEEKEVIARGVDIGRSIAECERYLRVVVAAPCEVHQLVVFGYDILRWKPKRIVSDLSSKTLEDLGQQFVTDYSSDFPEVARGKVVEMLHGFTERTRGNRTLLAECFKDATDERKYAAEIAHWRYAVQRRVLLDLAYLQILEDSLTDSRPRHEQIVSGLVEFVHWKPRTLVEEHLDESLTSLAERFEEGCCPKKRWHLRDFVQWIFRRLHMDPALEEKTLRNTVPRGQEPLDVFILWSARKEGRTS